MKVRAIFYLILLIIIIQFATLHIAKMLQYASVLGDPLFNRFYTFDYFFRWITLRRWRVQDAYRDVQWYLYSYFILILILETVILRKTTNKNLFSHGTAKWAKDKEILKIFGGMRGVIIGQTSDAKYTETRKGIILKKLGHILRDNDYTHILLSAATRAGKGVGIIIPTLLNWVESAIVIDIKGENFDVTSGWRSKFSKIIKWSPSNKHTHSFNPLSEIDIQKDNAIKLIEQVTDVLVNTEGKQHKDHWQNSASSLLITTISYLLEKHQLQKEPPPNFTDVLLFIYSNADDDKAFLNEIVDWSNNSMTKNGALAMLVKEDREYSSILSTAEQAIRLFRDPIIQQATNHSDFTADMLVNADVPHSLYIVVSPDDLVRLAPLLKMFYIVILNKLLSTLERKKHRLLLLLDEFPALGKIEEIEKGIAYYAGYGIKCLFVCQSLNQLSNVYGEKNSILDNSHVRIFYGVNDEKTASRVSQLLGKETLLKKNISTSGKKSSFISENMSKSEQEVGRDLMTTEQVLRMGKDDSLIITNGNPYLSKKIKYYCDPRFLKRLLPSKQLEIKKINEKNIDEEEIKDDFDIDMSPTNEEIFEMLNEDIIDNDGDDNDDNDDDTTEELYGEHL